MTRQTITPGPNGPPEPAQPEICARGERCVCQDPSPRRCNAFLDATKLPPSTGRIDT